MGQGRTLPLLGPVIVLYLAVELVASAPLDTAALVLASAGVLASLLPMLFARPEEPEAFRRLALMATAAAVALVGMAQADVRSLSLELAAAVAGPPIGSLVVDLALDAPDRPPGLARARALRGLSYAIALAAAAVAALVALPPFELFGELVLVPASLAVLGPAVLVVHLSLALAIRVARRRLGSAPEALAANGLALLGVGAATVVGFVALALVTAGVLTRGAWVIRGLACGGAAALLLGHLAMLDPRRPVHAARASRRVIAAALTATALGAALGALAGWVPSDPIALGVLAIAFLASGALAFRLATSVVDALLAPDGGRLLRAIEEAHAALSGAHTIEDVGAAVLGPLRRAARATNARPVLQTLAPARQIAIDAAGLPHVEARELSSAIVTRLTEHPGDVVVLTPLRTMVVRRPDLRPLVEALEHLEALCVVPIAAAGELEGALVVPRGRRRAPLTLEEIAALEGLAARLVGLLAAYQAEARAQERAGKALLSVARLEERVDALEDELERLRVEARTLKAGRASDRLPAPAIAYSPAMRRLIARIQEVAPTLAPVQVLAEGGNAIDQIGHLIHGASPLGEGPFVIADCASIRPERGRAALFGDESEAGSHPGWLRLASGGTLLLVDVPALSREAQAALAEAIASRSARAEGGNSAYPVEVRLVAHARVDVGALARLGRFDPELARWLEPLRLEVPPLRERREDLPSLVLVALDRACRAMGREILGIEEDALARLVAYDWPGNLRELQWVIDRAVASAEPPRVRTCNLGALSGETGAPPVDPLQGTWSEIEQRILRSALERAAGNKSEAARLLGLKRTTFLDKLRRAGFEVRESLPPQ
jgi:DNA-binding NtrC family response regulator